MDELEQIRSKVDIVSFIAEYLPLKKAGRNFKVHCPFHNEKTPSFIVSPERQIFHCFGCNVGGDIFSFFMKYENSDFPEALRTLAKRAGVELKKRAFDSEASRTRERLYEVNHLASEFYHYLLTNHPTGEKALSYLRERGIHEGVMKTFQLGFAPNFVDSLIRYLVGKKKYTLADLAKAGLVTSGKDLFQNRVMFPLSDHRGNVVGFSGRIVTSEGEGKYINTPETPIYRKGDHFFGLDRAKEHIKKENVAIVVEGEFDVLQAYQNGIQNVVAIKGTALTPNQAKLICRFTEKVSLCLDQDAAGFIAAKRGIETLENANLSVSVIRLEVGKDPDESLRTNPSLFQKAVKRAVSIYDFLIEEATARFNVKEAEGKKKMSEEVVPFLANIQNAIVKDHYVQKLASAIDVSYDAVLREVARVEKKEGVREEPSAIKEKRDREEVFAEYLLALLIQATDPKSLFVRVREAIKTIAFPRSLAFQKIFGYLDDFLTAQPFSIKKFVQFVPQELIPTIDRAYLLFLPSVPNGKYLLEVEKTIRELKLFLLRNQMREVGEKIKRAEEERNERELAVLKESFKRLTLKLSLPAVE